MVDYTSDAWGYPLCRDSDGYDGIKPINSYSKTYSFSSGQLSAGIYTMKIINY